MSNELFPTLPGLAWRTEKEPEYDTLVKRSVSGYEVRSSRRDYPVYTIKMVFEFLRSSATYPELQAIVGLFLRHRGQADSFLLLDPDDSVANATPFGVGDGSRRTFQLTARWAGFTQPAAHIRALDLITIGGSPVGGSAIQSWSPSTGIVTLATAPAAGAILTWSGSYYYRCRFADDTLTPRQLMQDIWELGKCELRGATGRQIG